MKPPIRLLGLVAPLFAAVGCNTVPLAPDRTGVAAHLTGRIGQTLPDRTAPGQIAMPPGASLDHALTDDEAVGIALWNNAAFQELLVDLGIARGDLIQAGLLPNPEFVWYWGVTDKPFKYLFDYPIEALWLRPIRVKAAKRDVDRTADRLAQAGLDLMRDVRQAYADVLLAKERVRVAGEAVTLRGKIAELAEKRLKDGDISPQEAATAKIDSLQAEQDATRIGYDLPVAEERLRNLMGVGRVRCPLTLEPTPLPAFIPFDADTLTKEAMTTRPDAMAAAQLTAAAEARVRFAKLGWVRFLGIADATSGVNGHEFGPALRLTVPLFNRNQGGIARAEAELERAVRNQQTVANQIILDVQRAGLQYKQACAELDALRRKTRPEIDAAVVRVNKAYADGDVALFVVLETTRQQLDSYLREATLHGDVRRTWAELERSVGRRLAALAPSVSATPLVAPEPPKTPTVPEPLKPPEVVVPAKPLVIAPQPAPVAVNPLTPTTVPAPERKAP